MVLICLIFSVLSTIEQYSSFANETLFWMVSRTLINSRNLSEKWVLNLPLLDLRTLHWAGCIKCCHLHLRWRHLYQNRLFRVPSHSGNQGKPWKGVSNFPVRENSGNLVKTQKNQGIYDSDPEGKGFRQFGWSVGLVPCVPSCVH